MEPQSKEKTHTLLEIIESSNWWDFEKEEELIRAIRTLGELKDPIAVPPLINLLSSVDPEYNPQLCNAIAISLIKIGDKSAIPFFIGRLNYGYDGPNYSYAKVLVGFGTASIPYLTKALYATSGNVRIAAAWALTRLQWSPDDDQNRAAFLCAINRWNEVGKYGQSATLPLLITLQDQEYLDYISSRSKNFNAKKIKSEIISLLGTAGDPKSIRGLVEFAKGASFEMALSAIKVVSNISFSMETNYDALSKYRTEIDSAIELLIHVFRSIEEDNRDAAVIALSMFGGLTFPHLERVITDDDVCVRRCVLDTLARLVAPETLYSIINASSNEDSDVRALTEFYSQFCLEDYSFVENVEFIDYDVQTEKEYCRRIFEKVKVWYGRMHGH